MLDRSISSSSSCSSPSSSSLVRTTLAALHDGGCSPQVPRCFLLFGGARIYVLGIVLHVLHVLFAPPDSLVFVLILVLGHAHTYTRTHHPAGCHAFILLACWDATAKHGMAFNHTFIHSFCCIRVLTSGTHGPPRGCTHGGSVDGRGDALQWTAQPKAQRARAHTPSARGVNAVPENECAFDQAANGIWCMALVPCSQS